MADTKISDLPAATLLDADDLIPVVEDGTNVKATIAQVTAAEATLARNADNLTSGTVADARIDSTIARDSEVTAAVSGLAPLASPTFTGAPLFPDGTAANPGVGFSADPNTGLTRSDFAGQILDLVVNAAIRTRWFSGGATQIRGGTEATAADGTGDLQIGASGSANMGLDATEIQARSGGAAAQLDLNPAGGVVAVGGTALGSLYQPLDADLTDIAAISDAQGDIIVRGASGWERLAKSATATDVLTAGASQPAWAAPSGGAAPQANRARFTFYGVPGVVPDGGGVSSGAMTADSEYCAPFVITAATNITEIGIDCMTNVAASTCIVGIRYDVDGVRGDVAYQSTGLDTSTTGFKSVAGSPLVVLQPGVYWWVAKPSAAIAIRVGAAGAPGSNFYVSSGDGNNYCGLRAAGSSGALPATPPAESQTTQFGRGLLFQWDLA